MLAGRRHGDAVDRRAAGRRAGEPGEDLERGRLAGAVRAEEAEHGAGRDVERQVGQGLDVLVVLGEAVHRDRVGHRITPFADRDDARGGMGVVSWDWDEGVGLRTTSSGRRGLGREGPHGVERGRDRQPPLGIRGHDPVGRLAAGLGDAGEVRRPTGGHDPRVLARAALDEAGASSRGGGDLGGRVTSWPFIVVLLPRPPGGVRSMSRRWPPTVARGIGAVPRSARGTARTRTVRADPVPAS